MTDTLFHYCSNSAFHSIMTARKLRLSLLTMSNDAKEGQHAVDIVHRLLPSDFQHKAAVVEGLMSIITKLSALGFCLSAQGDLLSQWRGYADSARGVAIGFSRDGLERLADEYTSDHLILRLAPVAYGQGFLEEMIKNDLEPIIQHYNSGKINPPAGGGLLWYARPEAERSKDEEEFKNASIELFHMLMRLANYFYMIKSPFFAEENEQRLLGLVPIKNGKLALQSVRFLASPDALKPYQEAPHDTFDPKLITQVILGPRNLTPTHVMRLFLDSNGFEHVEMKNSGGSYR